MSAKAQKLETCDHSYLPKDQCTHCLTGPARLTPHYELKSDWFEGFPVVEILKDGGPVHPYDERFRFGVQKAWLLLSAINVIREFADNTDDEGNTTVRSQYVHDGFGTILQIWVEMREEFVRSTGEKIQKPWLQIRKLPQGPEIGVGVQKSKAIWALRKDLKDWIERT